jgi:hypothetical protein
MPMSERCGDSDHRVPHGGTHSGSDRLMRLRVDGIVQLVE